MPAKTTPRSREKPQFQLFEQPSQTVVRELQELAILKRILHRRKISSGKYGSAVAEFLSAELGIEQAEFDFGGKPIKREKEVNPFSEIELSLGDAIRLHLQVLKHMYHLLADKRTATDTREWVLEWVMEPIIIPPERANRERPFSLQACANAYGVRADSLQMLMLSKFGLHRFIEEVDDWVEMTTVEESVFNKQYWSTA